MAAARTVAVVVPSPATSLVLVATSRTICAPMFWKRSARSISFATVTPSLVTVGAPGLLHDHVAALGTEGHGDRIAENPDAAKDLLPRRLRKRNLLCCQL